MVSMGIFLPETLWIDLDVRLDIAAAGAEADDHPLRGATFVDRNELAQDEHVVAGRRDRSRGAHRVEAHVLDAAYEMLGESVRHRVADLLFLVRSPPVPSKVFVIAEPTASSCTSCGVTAKL